MNVNPEKIIAGLTRVAALPAVALKFSEAIQNPMTTNQDLENIISEDSALASRVLRIANSAMFNFPSKIDTISKAISIIGQQQIHDIILSCSIIKVFGEIDQNLIDMEQFWRHNLAVGAASRVIAAMRRENNIERFFIAGLLHDIGRLVLLAERTQKMNAVFESCRDGKGFIFSEEKTVFGFDHAYLGALLLKKWQLPAILVNAVQYHHTPSLSPGFKNEAGIVHVADIIAHALNYGSSGEHYVPMIDKKVWEFIDIDIDNLDMILEQVYVQYNEAVKYILNDEE